VFKAPKSNSLYTTRSNLIKYEEDNSELTIDTICDIDEDVAIANTVKVLKLELISIFVVYFLLVSQQLMDEQPPPSVLYSSVQKFNQLYQVC